MSFYLTLPSNSSIDYFPGNTIAQYTTKLVKSITLEGEWEVALVEVIYPYSFLNVPELCTIEVDGKGVVLPSGEYKSVLHVLKVMNNIDIVFDVAEFVLETVSGKVYVMRKKPEVYTPILLGDNLLKILGFKKRKHGVSDDSEEPADLSVFVPQQLFIYSDIVENQFVGDSSSPLLRTIGVNDRKGRNVHVTFPDAHYVRVQKRHFSTIDIDIRTRTGTVAPFRSGVVTCKLHFRKV